MMTYADNISHKNKLKNLVWFHVYEIFMWHSFPTLTIFLFSHLHVFIHLLGWEGTSEEKYILKREIMVLLFDGYSDNIQWTIFGRAFCFLFRLLKFYKLFRIIYIIKRINFINHRMRKQLEALFLTQLLLYTRNLFCKSRLPST